MNQIVIFNQSSGYLTTDIANAFARSGKYDEVILVSGNKIDASLFLEKSVSVDKMPAYVKSNTRSRFMSWIKGAWSIVRMARGKYKNCELFLISNPPTIAFSTKFFNNKYSTLIYDVYPNGLSDGGFVKKNNIIYRIWAKRNKKFFAEAEHVYTITDGMKQTISDYCPIEKIEVVELWGDSNLPVLNVPKEENRFILENGLKGKFIVMYSGNIGKGHDLDVLVDVAEKLKVYEDIMFLFVGQGYLKPIIEKKTADYGLKNVIILPYQDRSMLPYSLSCSDLSVVSTNKKGGKVCIPSKTFDLVRLGKPILCIAELDSDIALFVNKHGIGRSFSCEQVDLISSFILEMHDNPDKLKTYIEASYETSKYYTSALADRFVK